MHAYIYIRILVYAHTHIGTDICAGACRHVSIHIYYIHTCPMLHGTWDPASIS